MAATIPVRMERAPVRNGLIGVSLMTDLWQGWMNALVRWVNRAPVMVGDGITLAAQGASIGATALPTGTLEAGVYEVRYYARITRPGTLSSSLTVALGWTDGVAQALTGAAMTGNTTTTYQQGGGLITLDGATSVTFTTTYASAGATSMQYGLVVRLKKLPTAP